MAELSAMLMRRHILATAAALPAAAALARPAAAQESFDAFLVRLRADALRQGISDATLRAALAGLTPNAKVLERDRHQPEFTLTWAQYRAKVITETKLSQGRAAYQASRNLLRAVSARYGVNPDVILGIWGLESSYGRIIGDYGVVQALATLAWDGRRASFFRGELMAAFRILDHGDVTPPRMTGSYAGAMGQPQFMPSSYLRYAVDFDGDGHPNIWTSEADVLASIANYLARSGWRDNSPWGQPVIAPPSVAQVGIGRDNPRTLAEWMQLGVRRIDGSPFSRGDVRGSLLMPDGAGGDAFMVYANFNAIRRYNPSDFYALAVGILGDQAVRAA